ncbi:glycogen/starch/alpha-glucan phosphorylase [Paracoccus sp. p3-h83]|uniref:glycogen/starch/alpha-glucan phosphorylase n=1 Tax=Paracoccus sp. p3-h83 TaxID=3342805 RepID=UPI0035BB1C89
MTQAIRHHLTFTMGKDEAHASLYDWRMALSFALRDRIVAPWFAATRKAYDNGLKRVYYLSMEFLIGRLIEDAAMNLGLYDIARDALTGLGQDFDAVVKDEPDAALGNGGLGRLAACYLESMATLGCPSYGYGIRYEHGLFAQDFDHGRQIERPEHWLSQRHPWEFERPEATYRVTFGGHVSNNYWHPAQSVLAEASDTPVIGWQGRWANTLRLWSAKAEHGFDLARFNAGDYAAAAAPEAFARTLSRVLYPDDTTWAGKELRLKQEYFLTSAAVQDILRRYLDHHTDLTRLPDHVAIQMNDTHPAIAGAELVRILHDIHAVDFAPALEIATRCLGFTNHTLLPEALECWPEDLMRQVLPRHLDIIARIDEAHRAAHPNRPGHVGALRDGQVHMGDLAFMTAHKVNGVSALHTDLVKSQLFPDLGALHPGRIVNVTNGVTPRRWLRLANPGLSALITEAIGAGWEADLDRLAELKPLADDAGFRADFRRAKAARKEAVAPWLSVVAGAGVNPAAMFDVQVKRIHEYKRQLMNILQAVADWDRIKAGQGRGVPRLRVFGGKAAPGYAMAKDIIRLINDVARTVNADAATRDQLLIAYPANYNVTMAEKLIPAADLSEQISTAGKEASGTGNMKFALNGALTIGTLDGANVEIRDHVGAENFILFGMTADQVQERRQIAGHAAQAIAASPVLQRVIALIEAGTFNPDDPARYHGLMGNLRHHDYFMVASDFDAYDAAQAEADRRFAQPEEWARQAILNVAGMGFFSSDRAVRAYMKDIWGAESAL